MTREEALAKAATCWWETATAREIAEFQLGEKLLCLPFDRLHQAVQEALGRPVYTHEFARPEWLLGELRGQREPLDPLDSLQAIAPGKPVVVIPAPAGEEE